MGKFRFRKEERLTKEKDIQELFSKGSSFYLFPFRVIALACDKPPETPHQVLVSVSKKNFRHAVDRNLIKRRMREAYRLNKCLLPAAPPYHIAFLYTHKEALPHSEISRKMVHVLTRISKGLKDGSKTS